jgi:hypothetical protein
MTRAISCPGCKQQIGIADPPEIQENILLRQQIEEIQKEPRMPSHIPAFKCKNGNCGEIHANKNYTRNVKGKCRNCDQFSPDLNDNCPWCGQNDFDEMDDDEL